MPEIYEVNDEGGTKFAKGDRVVLHGLVEAPELNGRHGVVAAVGLRCAVHLDTLRTFVLPADNLETEVEGTASSSRVDVYDGALYDAAHHSNPLQEAAHVIRLFHLVKWMACTQQLKARGQTTLVTLDQVRAGVPAEISHSFHAYAIQNWEGDGGIHERLQEYAKQQSNSPPGFDCLLQSALAERRAMKSWHCGIQNNFWFVGRDASGTFVVPDRNQDLVYKIVGIVNKPPAEPATGATPASSSASKNAVSIIKVPMRLRITIYPWYGRLLYDTTVPPVDPTSVVYATTVTAAVTATKTATNSTAETTDKPPLARHLHSLVMQAIQTGRVIEQLVELDSTS